MFFKKSSDKCLVVGADYDNFISVIFQPSKGLSCTFLQAHVKKKFHYMVYMNTIHLFHDLAHEGVEFFRIEIAFDEFCTKLKGAQLVAYERQLEHHFIVYENIVEIKANKFLHD